MNFINYYAENEITMKKKLLITLGCSFTEGVGAYDLNQTYKVTDETITLENLEEFHSQYKKNNSRFHEYAWPVKLQKRLNYEVLVNLGYGGSSNSHQAKKFYEYFHNSNISEKYDVLVIWMMTFSNRVSFYSNGFIRSCIVHSDKNVTVNDCSILTDAYINFVKNVQNDSLLETIFYLKTVHTLCQQNNFNFLYLTLESHLCDKIDELYPTNYFLNKYASKSQNWKVEYMDMIPSCSAEDRSYMQHAIITSQTKHFKSPVCMHPNEHGYEFAASRLYHIIDEWYPSYINRTDPVPRFKNLYVGEKPAKQYYISREQMENEL